MKISALSLSLHLSVGLHIDWTLLRSCTFVSLTLPMHSRGLKLRHKIEFHLTW